MIPRTTIDFETRSACDLRRYGSWRYSLDPSTSVLCLAYHVPGWDTDRVGLWHPALPPLGLDESVSDDIYDLIEWIGTGGLVEAHNAWFERGVWTNIMVPRYGFPPIAHAQWRCSAAKAAALALPRALGDAVLALKLDTQKDAAGHLLMKKISKPRKALKQETAEWANEHGTGKCTQCKGKGTYKRKPCEKCDGAGVLGEDDAPPLPVLWHETPEQIVDLFEYCKTDVLAEKGLSDSLPDLNRQETALYLLDQRINERGFQLDTDAVAAALTLIDAETADLNAQLAVVTKGEVTKATQRQRITKWFASRDLILLNTQGATIDKALEESTNPELTQALTIVRELGRSSTAKYQAMRRWACPDGRVRGGLLYHGATTGRWSGAGVQPHNFVRGTVKDQIELWTVLKTADRAAIRAQYGSVMLALANALRGAICARPGYQLYVADYAQIEARVILWLAGDEEHLDLFRSGADIYSDMAAHIYGRPINKKDNHNERQLGKAAILGCLAAGTLVLTPRGWVAIEQIREDDKVWDGDDWVAHAGVIRQGIRPTISRQGLCLTSDHLILSGNRWVPAEVALRGSEFSRALATGSANLPSKATFAARAEAYTVSWCSVPAVDQCIASLTAIYAKVRLLTARLVQRSKRDTGGRGTTVTQISSNTTSTGRVFSIVSVPSSTDAPTPTIRLTDITGSEASQFTPCGSMTDARFWRTWSRWKVGIARLWSWIAKTIIAAMSPATFDSSLVKPMLTTAVQSESFKHASSNWKPVYDIADAGPRQRFTVATTSGPVIVHNCGFQMGWKRFIESALVLGQVIIEEPMARQTIDAYRAKYWRVVNMWGDQEQAAKDATLTWERQPCGKVTWFRDERFLFCELPSGRRLSYPFPEVQQRQTSWGEWKLTLTFEGVDPYTRQWKRQSTYGGMLVENIVQAVARDVMADAMLRCEQSTVYSPVLSVHDELVCEAPEGVDVTAFDTLVAQVPTWLTGCPIAVDSFVSVRYKK